MLGFLSLSLISANKEKQKSYLMAYFLQKQLYVYTYTSVFPVVYGPAWTPECLYLSVQSQPYCTLSIYTFFWLHTRRLFKRLRCHRQILKFLKFISIAFEIPIKSTVFNIIIRRLACANSDINTVNNQQVCALQHQTGSSEVNTVTLQDLQPLQNQRRLSQYFWPA